MIAQQEEAAINTHAAITPARSDAYVAVSTAVSLTGSAYLVSTGATLRTVRKLSPCCRASDEELIALIVAIASGRTMGVSFDHHEAG